MILPGILSSQISGHLFTLTGSYDALATVTVPSGGASSITFSAIPQTGYSHLQIRASATNGVQDDAVVRFNGDTGNNYSWHLLVGNGSAAQAYNATGVSSMRGICLLSPTGSVVGGGVTDILDYTNPNKNKVIRSLTGMDNNSGSTVAQIQFWSGSWYNTSAINTINIFPLGGTAFSQNSTFSLYGIK